jgi:hypothetical protein
MSSRLYGSELTMNRKGRIGAGLISTLLKLDAWASPIQSDLPAVVSTSLPGSTACDGIDRLAEALVDDAEGIERLLLLKSLQEAFFCVAPYPDLTASEITSRLKEFVSCWGKGAVIKQFLFQFFFNQLLLDLTHAGRTQAITYEMKSVAKMCRREVIAAYAPKDVMDRSTAETLIHNIQAGLLGQMKLAQ